jgi:septum site-determining protein MinD
VSAVRDADRIIGMIEAEEKGPAQLIINRIKPEMVKRNEMLSVEDVLELLAIDLVGLVPEDERVINSTNTGVPIVIDGKNKAGVAFRDIAHRLLGEDIPFPNLEQETGLFARLSRWMRKEGGK